MQYDENDDALAYYMLDSTACQHKIKMYNENKYARECECSFKMNANKLRARCLCGCRMVSSQRLLSLHSRIICAISEVVQTAQTHSQILFNNKIVIVIAAAAEARWRLHASYHQVYARHSTAAVAVWWRENQKGERKWRERERWGGERETKREVVAHKQCQQTTEIRF